MKPWKRVEPTTVHKIGWRTIVSKTFILPDGQTAVFDTERPEGQEVAIVIALTLDNKVILARQFRPGPETVLEELPAGLIDKGETPEEAASRELQEETGYIPGSMKYLGKYSRDPYSNLFIHVYLATDCTLHDDGQQLEDTEFIEVELISIEQLIDNAKNNKMAEVGAVFMGYEELQKLRRSS